MATRARTAPAQGPAAIVAGRSKSIRSADRLGPLGWACLLFMPTLALLTMESTPGASPQEIGVFLVFLLIFGIWAMDHFAFSKAPIGLRPLDTPILALFAFFLFDLIKLGEPDFSFRVWFEWRTFVLLLMYFPVSRLFYRPRHFRLLMGTFALSGVLLSIIHLKARRDLGADLSVLYLEMDISSSVPWWATLVLVTQLPGMFAKNRESTWAQRLWGLLALGVCMASASAGAARTPLITALICLSISTFRTLFKAKRNPMVPLAFTVLAALPLYYSTDLAERYAVRLQGEEIDFSFESRYERISEAWDIFLDNPFIGAVPSANTFYFWHPRYKAYMPGAIHSLYFHFLAHGGLIGFGALMFLAFRTVRVSRSVFRTGGPLVKFAETSAIPALALAIAAASSTILFQVDSWLCMGMMLGVLSSIHASQQVARRGTPRPSRSAR